MKQFLQRHATGRNVLILIGLYILMMTLVLNPAGAYLQEHSTGKPPLDLKMFYTPEEGYDELEKIDAEGRDFYARFEMTGDVVYPILYTLLFSLLWLFLLRRAFPPNHFLQRLWFVPFVPIVFDYLENICIVMMLKGLPDRPSGLGTVASVVSALKWAGLFATLLLVVVGLIRWAVKGLNKQREDR